MSRLFLFQIFHSLKTEIVRTSRKWPRSDWKWSCWHRRLFLMIKSSDTINKIIPGRRRSRKMGRICGKWHCQAGKGVLLFEIRRKFANFRPCPRWLIICTCSHGATGRCGRLTICSHRWADISGIPDTTVFQSSQKSERILPKSNNY